MDVDNFLDISEEEYEVHIRETLFSAQIPRVNRFIIWIKIEGSLEEYTYEAVSISELVVTVLELDPAEINAIEVHQLFSGIDRLGRALLIPFTIHKWNRADCRRRSFFSFFVELTLEGIRLNLRV